MQTTIKLFRNIQQTIHSNCLP